MFPFNFDLNPCQSRLYTHVRDLALEPKWKGKGMFSLRQRKTICNTSPQRIRCSYSGHTVKKGSRVSRLQPGCHQPHSPWAGIIQLWRHYSRPGRVWWWHPGWGRETREPFFYGARSRPLKGTAGANPQRESEWSIGYIVIELFILGGFRFVQSTAVSLCHLSTDSFPLNTLLLPHSNVRQLIIPSPMLIIFSVTFWDDYHFTWASFGFLYRTSPPHTPSLYSLLRFLRILRSFLQNFFEMVGGGNSRETLCGLGPWRPRFLQPLASKKMYMFFYGALGIVKV
jgi:hypothetical protein